MEICLDTPWVDQLPTTSVHSTIYLALRVLYKVSPARKTNTTLMTLLLGVICTCCWYPGLLSQNSTLTILERQRLRCPDTTILVMLRCDALIERVDAKPTTII
jgi:hypothetical protein